MVDTYPWQPSMNVNKLRTLNPEDVGWNHGKCEGVESGRGWGCESVGSMRGGEWEGVGSGKGI